MSYGLNVNLAPVLDVYRAAGDFDDQFQRSYSMNPQVVSALGADFVRAQQAAASRRRLSTSPASAPPPPARTPTSAGHHPPVEGGAAERGRVSLPGCHQRGVDLVMVSWAGYPHLGSDLPAGLSSAIVQGELRKRLDFTGRDHHRRDRRGCA